MHAKHGHKVRHSSIQKSTRKKINTYIKPDQNMLLLTIFLAQIKSPICENDYQNDTKKVLEEKPCKAKGKKLSLEYMTRGIPLHNCSKQHVTEQQGSCQRMFSLWILLIKKEKKNDATPGRYTQKCSGIALVKKRFNSGVMNLLPTQAHLTEHTNLSTISVPTQTRLFSHIIWRWVGGKNTGSDPERKSHHHQLINSN